MKRATAVDAAGSPRTGFLGTDVGSERIEDEITARNAEHRSLYERCRRADGCMLPTLFTSEDNSRPWSVWRAALYGAGIGLVSALIKIFGPFHAAGQTLPVLLEVCIAVLAFGFLCAGAALLRNLLARRLQDTPR